MTVKELIEMLTPMPQEASVTFQNKYEDMWSETRGWPVTGAEYGKEFCVLTDEVTD